MLNTLKRQAVSLQSNNPTTSTTNSSSSNKNSSNTNTADDENDRSRSTSTTNKRIKVTQKKSFPSVPVSKIYLISPPNVRTGGPEAMHQLCHQINSMTSSRFPHVTAYMLYLEERKDSSTFRHVTSAKPISSYANIYSNLKIAPVSWNDIEIPVSASLSSYSYSQEKEPQEYSDTLLIWPEVWTHLLIDESTTTTLPKKHHHQQCIWWLSVDNNNGKFTQWDRQDILHLYQSEYAKQYILRNMKSAEKDYSHRVLPMTEFIPLRSSSSSLVTSTTPTTTTSTSTCATEDDSSKSLSPPRDLQVLYNPLKGMHYTDEIRKRSNKKITFTPIGGGPHGRERISYEEVKAMLQRAKIYLDFGPHPGMDRLPREAALAHCIVITNREGAAGYTEDVPIPEEYKIQNFQVERIHKLLMDSLESYEEKTKDFEEYREWIRSQEDRMTVCVSQFLEFVTAIRMNRG